jgi:acyl-CoA synthetase
VKPLAARIDELAAAHPDAPAFFSDTETLSWREYAERSDRFAAHLAGLGLAPGERVAILLPDGPGVHVAFVGCEKAGLVVMGIGPRAGREEIRHLVQKSDASALVTRAASRDLDYRALYEELRREGEALSTHIVVERQLDADEPCYENGPFAPREGKYVPIQLERGRQHPDEWRQHGEGDQSQDRISQDHAPFDPAPGTPGHDNLIGDHC